jgi:hypothetical protein
MNSKTGTSGARGNCDVHAGKVDIEFSGVADESEIRLQCRVIKKKAIPFVRVERLFRLTADAT